jgi:molybdate transport system substrate-binding protein
MHRIVDTVAPAFERSAGVTVAAAFASSGGVKSRVLDGETPDVVITTQAAMHDLAGKDCIVTDTIAAIARSPIGIAVRTGAPKPDVSTAAAFSRTLMQAKSIAYADPATGSPSASHLVQVLDRLGLTETLKPKTRLVAAAPGRVVVVCGAVARGEAEIGIQQISEIVGVEGVELAGPLPPKLQHLTIFSAAVGNQAANAEAARNFVAFLASPAARPAIEANGMLPG